MRKLSKKELAKRVKVLAQLKLNNGNLAKTSRQTGVTRATIRHWRDANETEAEKLRRQKELEEKQQAAVAEGVETVAKLMASDLEELVIELRRSILDDVKNPKRTWPLRDRAWAMAVMFDKLQVMNGRPTVISQTIGSLTEEQRAERAAELIARGRQRRLNGGGQAMAVVGERKSRGNRG